MKIENLKPTELEKFCHIAEVKTTWYGGRKFSAIVKFDTQEQIVTASAKEVYAAIKSCQNFNQVIENDFKKKELETRDFKKYSQSLSFIQKIMYFFIKKFAGLDWSDTWKGKIYECDYDLFANIKAINKLKPILNKHCNGAYISKVIVYDCNRVMGGGPNATESPYRDNFTKGGKDFHLLKDPSVVIIYIRGKGWELNLNGIIYTVQEIVSQIFRFLLFLNIGEWDNEENYVRENKCQKCIMPRSEYEFLVFGPSKNFISYMENISQYLFEKKFQ